MTSTTVDWKCVTAKGSFLLAHDLVNGKADGAVHLPPFCAPDDDDLTWSVSFKSGERLRSGSHTVAKRLSFKLHFKSASGKRCVFAKRIFRLKQTASKEDKDDVAKELLRTMAVSEKEFSVEKRFSFTDVFRSCALGEIIFCNKPCNAIHVYVCVIWTDKSMDVVNPPPCKKMRAADWPLVAEASLSSCLGSLLDSHQLADAALVVGGREFPVHRTILAARSTVFRAMMSTDCKEKESGKVVIEDLRPAVVELLLRYIYMDSPWKAADAVTPADDAEDSEDSGGSDVSEVSDDSSDFNFSDDSISDEAGGAPVALRSDGDEAGMSGPAPDAAASEDDDGLLVELMVAADKYMLPGLVALCQQRLADRLLSDPSDEKLCDVLRASHLLECAPLRRIALDYLRIHRVKVLKSATWIEFAGANRRVASDALLDAMMETDASRGTSV
ncbi:hypothetical protein ONE63_001094 [Megalurothrips usitatus]|uniref:BTB domain-containing protein n=1 Tax=Megalurothrips usitatus TaxID=439358 RepID=A0AAV7XEU5_9NEOP|nr:hypothetical protein ONE63_001094 [Megalurothrips usitatus]